MSFPWSQLSRNSEELFFLSLSNAKLCKECIAANNNNSTKFKKILSKSSRISDIEIHTTSSSPKASSLMELSLSAPTNPHPSNQRKLSNYAIRDPYSMDRNRRHSLIDGNLQLSWHPRGKQVHASKANKVKKCMVKKKSPQLRGIIPFFLPKP